MSGLHRAAIPALGAAVLFGASTPFAKQLVGTGSGLSFPFLLAGLLYLVLFVLALRELGTARTGAYLSTAPFAGAAISIVLFSEPTSASFRMAAALMATDVWLHLTDHHAHNHEHPELLHEHAHRHDEHHQHSHDFEWDGVEPHSHVHRHSPLKHRHAHFLDIQHRHSHI